MPDLSSVESTEAVRLVGSDSAGVEQTPVKSTTSGGLHINLRDNAGVELGTSTNPVFTSGNAELLSPLPSLEVRYSRVIAGLKTYTYTQSITTKTAITEFHVGGLVQCKCILARYVGATTSLVSGFNSAGDVTAWPSTSLFAPTSITYSTLRAREGTGSVQIVFTKSDQNNYPEITYTYGTPTDISGWRYVEASFYQNPSAGGSVTRTASVRLTDVLGNVRVYQVVLTSATAAGWFDIKTDITLPDSQTGTNFDETQISTISLRMVDGANKAGTIYWDRVRFSGAVTILDRIYSAVGTTVQLKFDPVKVFEIGEVLMLRTTNLNASSSEFFASTSGVNV